MKEQPEALRLADALTEAAGDYWQFHKSIGYGAAAELRRLVAEHEEDQSVIAVWRGRTQRAEAQRDALLEALKRAADFLHHATEFRFGHPGFEQTHAKARAAIKKAEEGK